MLLLLILLLTPLAALGLISWAFVRGAHKTKVAIGVTCAVIVTLSFIPYCKPLDLSQEDNNPVNGKLQGMALQTYLESNLSNGIDTEQWKKKDGMWYQCWSGANVVKKVYGTFFKWFFVEREEMPQKVLIQTE